MEKNIDATQPSGFSIKADVIEQHIMEKMPKEFQGALKRVVLAGMKILFSKETHSQLFDSIRPEDEVPLEDELGAGAANLMLLMFKESNNSMPLQTVIPAGSILLAKACEFINETKLAPITDETYFEAMHMFTSVMRRQFDPSMSQSGGNTPDKGVESTVQQPSPQPVQQPVQPAQSGGLISAQQGA